MISSNPTSPPDPEPWVIWNAGSGILATAALGRIEAGPQGRRAWMDRPFEMLGPFDLDMLEAEGRLAFAACIVMSRTVWRRDQDALRHDALARRRAAQARMEQEQARFHRQGGARRRVRSVEDERAHRAALDLPLDGALPPTRIKAAFRRKAQKAHPDLGGSHEGFVRVTEARDALLEIHGGGSGIDASARP